MRTRGLARPMDVARMYEELYGDAVSVPRVRLALRCLRCLRWLGTTRTWLWLEGASNRAASRIRKALSVAGELDVSVLHDAVTRHPAYQAAVPPASAVLELCRQLPWCEVDGRVVRLRDEAVSPLEPVDQTLVNVFRDHGPVLGLREAQRLCAEAGLNRNQVGSRLQRSPLIQRPSRGAYALVGAAITPDDVESSKAGRGRRCTLGRGWTTDGEAWCVYRLSESMAASGVFPFPATLGGCAAGEYILNDAAFIQVKGTSAWGLEPVLRAAGFEEGDVVVLKLDPVSRDAVLESARNVQFVDGEARVR